MLGVDDGVGKNGERVRDHRTESEKEARYITDLSVPKHLAHHASYF